MAKLVESYAVYCNGNVHKKNLTKKAAEQLAATLKKKYPLKNFKADAILDLFI